LRRFDYSGNIAASLDSAQLIHVASHGIQHPSEPLRSGLCPNDGVLTVERLMKLDLNNAFFAFLSACETAKGDKDQSDQTIHLAATLLFTGFKSIVGTMWYVSFSKLVGRLIQENE
jgi:CHAT domain-containing protein